jgi:hypothetical protein
MSGDSEPVTFTERSFTGQPIQLMSISSSEDGSMIGLEITTARETRNFVLMGAQLEAYSSFLVEQIDLASRKRSGEFDEPLILA